MTLLITFGAIAGVLGVSLLCASARIGVEHDARDAHRRSTEALARASRRQHR